jgi:hypothetical protein
MNTPRKFWLILIGAIVTMAVIACSCGSIIPTPTPTIPPSPTVPVNPMPGLEGYWLDTETNDVHVIEWQNNQYVVTAVNDDEYGSFAVTSQYWDGSALTWTYQVSYNDTSVTFTTVSVSGDSLNTNWSNNDGDSGTETLQRVSSPIPSASVDQEPVPSLASRWLDPDTTGTVTTIEEQNGEYVVVSVINPDRGVNEVTSSSYSNGVLTWEYCPPNMHCITSESVSVTSDSLTATWSWSDGGNSGTTVYQRLP